jgi:hypothetical protein
LISKKAAQRSREYVLKAKEQQAIQIAQEHMTEEDTPLLSQTHDPSLDQQIEINERIIADREQDLEGLERSIAEVNEIFRDLGSLVHEQQYLLGICMVIVDNIESNVNHVTLNMENAAGELRSASEYQRSTGKKYCYIFLVLLVITTIAVLSLRPWRWGH